MFSVEKEQIKKKQSLRDSVPNFSPGAPSALHTLAFTHLQHKHFNSEKIVNFLIGDVRSRKNTNTGQKLLFK